MFFYNSLRMHNIHTHLTREIIDQLGRIAYHTLRKTNSANISSTIQDRALEILQ